MNHLQIKILKNVSPNAKTKGPTATKMYNGKKEIVAIKTSKNV